MNDFLEILPSYVEKIKSIREIIISNIVLLGQIPSPTFKEEKRATAFLERLCDFPVDECFRDAFGNPIGIIRGTSRTAPQIFVVAHIDTFFDKDIVYNYTVNKKCIEGPGLLDNSLSVAILASLPDIIQELDLRFESDIVLAGVIQSIGKGNLQGVRHLLKTWLAPIRGAVCLEGFELGRLNYFSDGMFRCEITCDYRDLYRSGKKYRPNAILVLNEVINQILKLRIPQRPRSQIFIGEISGGTGHGRIAYNAKLGFEIRSHADELVKSMYNDIEDIVEGVSHENEVALKLNIISDLNATSLGYNHPLVKNTSSILKRLRLKPFSEPSESALSIFLSHKIPAVTLGITHGTNYYMENEKMEIDPMYRGIAQIIGVITAIDNGVCDE